ncbi:Transcription termination/antitermination protein NusA [Candidatus Kinetoplastibacterium sorsogonicusi]|uniref:Transcription termination/antitermination protein NusA n=1 Tax=Candidatus Kinetoplastidibacterium kentomonadis TaxID=1576550 RepID=A0A3Q8EU94_9PROT|nr:transcription termination factor NusA [Candidatus Kinetoplastibacterium sorsogonicusi]AWD32513.1 Transcription termination/antitermination protein NusA [Candidatus Kinetoplastibacterium sorsogonicusi]
MSREILLLVDALAREKNVTREIVFIALENALSFAMKKHFKEDIDIRISIDRNNGSYEVFRRWLVVCDEFGLQEPDKQEILSDAIELYPDICVGEYIEEKLEPIEFGRIGAQVAKQAILQRIREAEKEQLLNDFLDKSEGIISGTVKRFDKGDVIVETHRIEVRLPKSEIIPKENLRISDRVKAVFLKIDNNISRGKQVIISRTSPDFIIKLFEIEVPEIEQGLLEIKGASRDPGIRAKIAVINHDKRLDPIGTCVGIRGSRVNGVRSELGGEQIDIVLWSEDPAQFVINALAPASVDSIFIDEENHAMDVVVDSDNLPKAIGTKGQNVKLASELTKWKINIVTKEENLDRQNNEIINIKNIFIDDLNIEENIADILINEGFTSIEEIAYVPIQELLDIKFFDKKIVDNLRSKARNFLLTEAIANEKRLETSNLLEIEGITVDLIKKLSEKNILTRNDLAELSTDELVNFTGLNEKEASRIIMLARAPWFEK